MVLVSKVVNGMFFSCNKPCLGRAKVDNLQEESVRVKFVIILDERASRLRYLSWKLECEVLVPSLVVYVKKCVKMPKSVAGLVAIDS